MKRSIKQQSTREEWVRAVLVVYTTLFSLGLILFFGMAPYLSIEINPDESLGVVELVLPLLTGYIGLMLGYYYGTQGSKQ